MTVKELIQKLKKYKEEEKVWTYDPEEWVVEIKEVEEIVNWRYNSRTKKREKEMMVYIN